jgi:hypothetical protein
VEFFLGVVVVLGNHIHVDDERSNSGLWCETTMGEEEQQGEIDEDKDGGQASANGRKENCTTVLLLELNGGDG